MLGKRFKCQHGFGVNDAVKIDQPTGDHLGQVAIGFTRTMATRP